MVAVAVGGKHQHRFAMPALPPIPKAQSPQRVLTRRFATPRTILALMLREMSARYGRSPGGYLWALLEPLGAILILSSGMWRSGFGRVLTVVGLVTGALGLVSEALRPVSGVLGD